MWSCLSEYSKALKFLDGKLYSLSKHSESLERSEVQLTSVWRYLHVLNFVNNAQIHKICQIKPAVNVTVQGMEILAQPFLCLSQKMGSCETFIPGSIPWSRSINTTVFRICLIHRKIFNFLGWLKECISWYCIKWKTTKKLFTHSTAAEPCPPNLQLPSLKIYQSVI